MLIDATPADMMGGDLAAAAETAQRAADHAASCSRPIQQIAGVMADWIASARGLLPADQAQLDALRGTVASLPELPASTAATVELSWAACGVIV